MKCLMTLVMIMKPHPGGSEFVFNKNTCIILLKTASLRYFQLLQEYLITLPSISVALLFAWIKTLDDQNVISLGRVILNTLVAIELLQFSASRSTYQGRHAVTT